MGQFLVDTTTFLVILLMLVLAAWIARPVPGPEPIYLKGGERYEQSITNDAVVALDNSRGMVMPPERTYFAAQFDRPLTPSERTRLVGETDVRFLDAIPANSYIVSVPTMGGGPVLQKLLQSDPAARAIVDIKLDDKLSKELGEVDVALGTYTEDVPFYIESTTGGQTYQELFVRFYADVSLARQRQLLKDYADPVWDAHVDATAPAYGLWTVLLPEGNLGALAARPEVQSIEPGPPDTEDDMDVARPWVGVDASVIETGVGVRIAQFEDCMADDTHSDLSNVNRIDVESTYCATGTNDDHATMVAGVMIGDGSNFSNHLGIAPDAEVLAFDTDGFASEIIDDYVTALLLGTTLTNSSFGFDTADDLFYEVQGVPHLWYRTINGHYDRVTSARSASGAVIATGRKMTVVASTGNSGHNAQWGGTRVRNSAKNVITVGGVSTGPDAARNAPMSQGGRGPTGDGRLSPLLVAPSIEFNGAAWGVKSTAPVDTLGESWGTSFSTPIVSGLAALATEKFEAVCNAGPPSPADIRGVLVHTAQDLMAAGDEIYGKIADSDQLPSSHFHPDVNPATQYIGPDFIFGYGLVQAGDAMQAIGESRFARDSIEQGLIEYPIVLTPGSLENGHLRVTLTWDDPPFSDSGAVPSPATGFLQNDLDLVVVDPNGKRYYPWVLDKDNPATPATQSTSGALFAAASIKRDRRNTVEQVDIEVPQALLLAGSNTWTIQVRGSNMLLGPQAYTLVSKAIKPDTPCGDIPNIVNPYPPQPPGGQFDFPFLFLALLMLTILLFVLVRWVYFHYLQSLGPLGAFIMAAFALFIVLFVLFLLVESTIVVVAIVLALFAAYFYFGYP